MIYCWLAPRNTISSQHPRKVTGSFSANIGVWLISTSTVMSWKTLRLRRNLQLIEVAIQPAKDAGAVVANEEDLTALQI